MTDHTNLDRLIDDVARDITAHDAPAHLRSRVMARLDERRSPRRPWLFVPAALATAAAAVFMMIVINRSGETPNVVPAAAPPADVARIAPAAPVQSVDVQQQHPVAIASAAHDAARDAATNAAWREELLPSLPALPALPASAGVRVDIQPTALTIPQLTVKPLSVDPIDDNNQR